MSDAGRKPTSRGRRTDAATVAEFLAVLLDVDAAQTDTTMAVTLSSRWPPRTSNGLWEAVCEDLAERSLPPELEAGTLDPAMTVAEAAEAMARALGAATMTVDDL